MQGLEVGPRPRGSSFAFRVGGTKYISLEVWLEGMVDQNIFIESIEVTRVLLIPSVFVFRARSNSRSCKGEIMWIRISDTKHACPCRFSWFRSCGENESRKVLGSLGESRGILERLGAMPSSGFFFPQKTGISAIVVPELSRKCAKMARHG